MDQAGFCAPDHHIVGALALQRAAADQTAHNLNVGPGVQAYQPTAVIGSDAASSDAAQGGEDDAQTVVVGACRTGVQGHALGGHDRAGNMDLLTRRHADGGIIAPARPGHAAGPDHATGDNRAENIDVCRAFNKNDTVCLR